MRKPDSKSYMFGEREVFNGSGQHMSLLNLPEVTPGCVLLLVQLNPTLEELK